MKTLTTLFIAMLGVAFTTSCGDDTDSKNNDSSSSALTRAEAQSQVESGQADDDICLTNGFLDDGVCDDWCPQGDPNDCPVSDECTDGETRPAGDGCNTCECIDNRWACTEIACEPDDDSDAIVIRECDVDTDRLNVTEIRTIKDTLEVDVGYSGGCEEHVFTACWDGAIMESSPLQARIIVEHNANEDACEAYISETLTFDLTPMRNFYNAPEGTTIILRVEDSSADYVF